MFPAVFALAAAFVSVSAISVTSPTATKGWTNSGSNTATWTSVSTDALNFTLLLTKMTDSTYNQVLAALVTTKDGTVTVGAPSSAGGWPAPGSGYRLNLVQDQDHLTTIYAQSEQFNITAPTTPSGSNSAASSASTPAAPPVNPSGAAGGAAGGTAGGAAGASDASPSSSATDTGASPAGTGAALAMGVQTGFVAGAVLLSAMLAF
ncbi:hypothetical protein C8F04DRAFT_1068691 [Mycena alexandri]|uniref:Yeast cell wall synthesis Kre9/Knh1-like N-terminal domain-containing protein n=1 Tax=Mycena alexandri TaxID=1745969 RepID=A0AAD6XE01_9AGAR|nr:hypothetical protein C8F04DRAFT_1068691 [Mycena alexandri]